MSALCARLRTPHASAAAARCTRGSRIRRAIAQRAEAIERFVDLFHALVDCAVKRLVAGRSFARASLLAHASVLRPSGRDGQEGDPSTLCSPRNETFPLRCGREPCRRRLPPRAALRPVFVPVAMGATALGETAADHVADRDGGHQRPRARRVEVIRLPRSDEDRGDHADHRPELGRQE